MDDLQFLAPLCIFGFEGTSPTPWIRECISKHQLGGIILFKRNIESKDQVRELLSELKSLSSGVPLFLSVDHEGGRVFRLPPPFTQITTAREIAAKTQENSNYPHEIGALMGRELREVGFNLNYAPVLDVDTNVNNPIIGDRAFSNNPEIVAQCAVALMEGLRSEKVLPCGKHFPGHGDTSKDSHLELPVVEQSLERLKAIEFYPFRKAIEAQVEMLMTAHVSYPALDEEFPATLSSKILGKILRQELNYQGVVISDDLEMKAIAAYGIPEAAQLFLEAGGDIPLICRSEEYQRSTLEYLKQQVKEGKLSKDLLEQSLKRIISLKKQKL